MVGRYSQLCVARNQQIYLDEFVGVLTYAYNTSVYNSTKYALFDLVLSQPPSDLQISGYKDDIHRTAWTTKENWVLKMVATIARAGVDLKKVRVKCKMKLDRRMGRGKTEIKEGDFVSMDVQDGMAKEKLCGHTEGPLEVIS